MAVEYISAVWRLADRKAEQLLVLLACADWANTDGEFWPSYEDIADKARITKPGAIGIMRQLIDAGEITVVERSDGGRYRRNRYRFGQVYLDAVDLVRGEWDAARAKKRKPAQKNDRPDLPLPEEETVNENDGNGKRELAHIRNKPSVNRQEGENAPLVVRPIDLPSVKPAAVHLQEPDGDELDRIQQAVSRITGAFPTNQNLNLLNQASISIFQSGGTFALLEEFEQSLGKQRCKLNFIAQDFGSWFAARERERKESRSVSAPSRPPVVQRPADWKYLHERRVQQ